MFLSGCSGEYNQAWNDHMVWEPSCFIKINVPFGSDCNESLFDQCIPKQAKRILCDLYYCRLSAVTTRQAIQRSAVQAESF